MTEICVTPISQSIAQGNKFALSFDRIANTIFQCTKTNIPGISLTEGTQQTPLTTLRVPGTKIIFEPLEITFLVDAQYRSWVDIWTWMNGLGAPENSSQYANLSSQAIRKPGLSPSTGIRPPYSDATMTVYTNKNNAQIRISFTDCYPISLSSIPLAYDMSPDVILTSTASFRYSYYTFAYSS